MQYVVDKAGEGLMIVADQVVAVSQAAAQAFADQVNKFGQSLTSLINKLQTFGNRASEVFAAIVNDPVGFANTILTGVSTGVKNFFNHLGTHVPPKLLDWFFGGTPATEMPDLTSLSSIASFFLTKMGASWDHVLDHLVNLVGADNIALFDQAFETIANVVERGPAGMVEFLKEQADFTAAKVKDLVLKTGVDYLLSPEFLGPVLLKIAATFVPGGAVLTTIYNTVSWVYDQANRLADLGQDLVAGVDRVIRKDTSGVATLVENALAKAIVPALDFAASWVPGLKEAKKGVSTAIESVHHAIDAPIELAAGKIRDLALGIFRKNLGLPAGAKPWELGQYQGLVGTVHNWQHGPEQHRLWVTTAGGKAAVWVASNNELLSKEIGDLQQTARQKNIDIAKELNSLRSLDQDARGVAEQIARLNPVKDKAAIANLKVKLQQVEGRLISLLAAINTRILGVPKPTGVWADIIKYRASISFPTIYTGDRSVDKVVAVLQIGTNTFTGRNGWISATGHHSDEVWNALTLRYNVGSLNRNTFTHAEGHVFYQALLQGVTGNSATLYVDSTFCNSCGSPFYGLRGYAQSLGIQQLVVYQRLEHGEIITFPYKLS